MKELTLIVFMSLVISSCELSESHTEAIETTETTVEGHVSDIERSIDIENFKVVLVRTWDDWSVVQYVLGIEIIDSVRTDAHGNYSMTFDYIHGERYGFLKQYYGSPYYIEFIQNRPINKGVTNIRNIDAWYPTILKIELNVTNNEYPHLRLSNKIIGNSNFHFATADIFETNIDTIVYQRTKPNSQVELNFHYSTGYTNDDYHYYLENVTTTLRDTINLLYNIDCSTF